MRKVAMCLSLWQYPRYRIHTLANSWWGSFPSLGRSSLATSNRKTLGSSIYMLEEGHNRRLSRRIVATKAEGKSKDCLSNKTNIGRDLLDESASTKMHRHRSRVTIDKTQFLDIRQLIAENKDLSKLLTFIVFDIETTGFCKRGDRIIEIAFQDLQGGKNSTFQALVNPQCYVPNSYVHGISTHMVNRPDVPRMEDLIPIILKYIQSRQKPGGYVVLIAHNARGFDVPFLSQEFRRCSHEIPGNWVFFDTLPLAKEVLKSKGLKGNPKANLEALVKYYDLPLDDGTAHRALTDVKRLSLVFQRMTYDLKLSVSSLVVRTFIVSELGNSKKKKSSGQT